MDNIKELGITIDGLPLVGVSLSLRYINRPLLVKYQQINYHTSQCGMVTQKDDAYEAKTVSLDAYFRLLAKEGCPITLIAESLRDKTMSERFRNYMKKERIKPKTTEHPKDRLIDFTAMRRMMRMSGQPLVSRQMKEPGMPADTVIDLPPFLKPRVT